MWCSHKGRICFSLFWISFVCHWPLSGGCPLGWMLRLLGKPGAPRNGPQGAIAHTEVDRGPCRAWSQAEAWPEPGGHRNRRAPEVTGATGSRMLGLNEDNSGERSCLDICPEGVPYGWLSWGPCATVPVGKWHLFKESILCSSFWIHPHPGSLSLASHSGVAWSFCPGTNIDPLTFPECLWMSPIHAKFMVSLGLSGLR